MPWHETCFNINFLTVNKKNQLFLFTREIFEIPKERFIIKSPVFWGTHVSVEISKFLLLFSIMPCIRLHCVKRARIQSFPSRYFLAFGLNTKRYGISLWIQSEYRKMRTRKTLNTDTIHAVLDSYYREKMNNHVQRHSKDPHNYLRWRALQQ